MSPPRRRYLLGEDSGFAVFLRVAVAAIPCQGSGFKVQGSGFRVPPYHVAMIWSLGLYLRLIDVPWIQGVGVRRNLKWFRGGLVFKAHGLVYH